MIRIIAAISLDRAIGVYEGKRGKLPWHGHRAVPGDLKYFQELTHNGVVIMGRKTFESIGNPLPDRRNIVVTKRSSLERKALTAPNITRAIKDAKAFSEDIWLIGGKRIFEEGQRFADEIILTVIPFMAHEHYSPFNLVYFPAVNEKIWKNYTSSVHPLDPELRIIEYKK